MPVDGPPTLTGRRTRLYATVRFSFRDCILGMPNTKTNIYRLYLHNIHSVPAPCKLYYSVYDARPELRSNAKFAAESVVIGPRQRPVRAQPLYSYARHNSISCISIIIVVYLLVLFRIYDFDAQKSIIVYIIIVIILRAIGFIVLYLSQDDLINGPPDICICTPRGCITILCHAV